MPGFVLGCSSEQNRQGSQSLQSLLSKGERQKIGKINKKISALNSCENDTCTIKKDKAGKEEREGWSCQEIHNI